MLDAMERVWKQIGQEGTIYDAKIMDTEYSRWDELASISEGQIRVSPEEKLFERVEAEELDHYQELFTGAPDLEDIICN